MIYTLTSNRKIGRYNQKIITNWINAPLAPNDVVFTTMSTWNELISSLDPVGRSVGTITYKGITQTDNTLVDNTEPSFGSGMASIVCTNSGKPKMLNFNYDLVNKNNLTNTISGICNKLIGLQANNNDCYVTTVIINITE